jgi:hypothetical protein
MPEGSTLDTGLEAAAKAIDAPEEDEALDDEQEDGAAEQGDKDDRQLNTLLRKCEHAFTKGSKGLLL